MRIRVLRRSASVAAVVGGALLMWLSPESLAGEIMMVAGIALEVVGIALERR
jgi:hypothetical protein